jgi:hemoglobin
MKLSKLMVVAAAASLFAAAPAFAVDSETAPIPQEGVGTQAFPGIPQDTVEKLGGPAGVKIIVDDLFYYILDDNRINQLFISHGKVERQKALNTELVQLVLGGHKQYEGASMGAAHGDLGITVTMFNAVVEDAYLAFEKARTPYSVANQIIAGLAPFERDIVTR